jgi:AraC-like DNA-binding protein
MRYSPPQARTIVPADFHRPSEGPFWNGHESVRDVPVSGLPAWQSNGGPHRGHPLRSAPFTLEVPIPEGVGQLTRVHILGVFALWAERANEPPGTIGATVQLGDSDHEVLIRQDLLNGRHYLDAGDTSPFCHVLGDGTSIETVGTLDLGETTVRVDLLTIDVPPTVKPDVLRFKDLGSPASFLIFDIGAEYEHAAGCPFKVRSGGVSLSELAAVVRVGDRLKFTRAVEQLEEALIATEDLDEARGQALTFLAVVTAATIEMGGSREMHRIQLEAARKFDQLSTAEAIADEARNQVERIAGVFFEGALNPSAHLVNRALSIVDRHYAKSLTDSAIAAQLGLSTSHFRFLFKQATGQPFHKYLVAIRLEKAKQMLLERQLPVSDVAAAVGFTGLSHFSRAFTQRFSVSPTSLRRLAR